MRLIVEGAALSSICRFSSILGASPHPGRLQSRRGPVGPVSARSVGCISPPPMPSCPARPSWHSPSGCTCCFCASLGSLSKQSPQAWPPGVGPPCTTSFLSKSWDADSLRWKHPVCRKINRQLKQGCDSEQTTGLRAADKAGLAASAAVPSPLQRWVPRRAAASFLSLPQSPPFLLSEMLSTRFFVPHPGRRPLQRSPLRDCHGGAVMKMTPPQAPAASAVWNASI